MSSTSLMCCESFIVYWKCVMCCVSFVNFPTLGCLHLVLIIARKENRRHDGHLCLVTWYVGDPPSQQAPSRLFLFVFGDSIDCPLQVWCVVSHSSLTRNVSFVVFHLSACQPHGASTLLSYHCIEEEPPTRGHLCLVPWQKVHRHDGRLLDCSCLFLRIP